MQAEMMNGGDLAFVGDALMTLQVRTFLIEQGITSSQKLQSYSSYYNSAVHQAAFAREIEGELDEKSLEIFKRGRNYKSHSTAKNASVIDYRYATALEALWGYWYLNGEYDRLKEMFMRFTGDFNGQ